MGVVKRESPGNEVVSHLHGFFDLNGFLDAFEFKNFLRILVYSLLFVFLAFLLTTTSPIISLAYYGLRGPAFFLRQTTNQKARESRPEPVILLATCGSSRINCTHKLCLSRSSSEIEENDVRKNCQQLVSGFERIIKQIKGSWYN